MRAVSPSILLVLLLAMCSLCAVQWWRESALREMAMIQRFELLKTTAARDELDSRMKNADAEILRLTTAVGELRANSVAKQAHDDAIQANTQLRENIEKQNVAIKGQNEAIANQNAAVQQANDHIKKLITDRDDLAKRLNEVTARYNKLVDGKKSN